MHDVAIERNPDPAAAVRGAMDRLGGMRAFVEPGQTVLVKPNFLMSDGKPGTVTSGAVIIEVVRQILACGAKPVVGEAGSGAKGLDAFTHVGAYDFCAENGVPMKNLNEDEIVEIDIPGGTVFPKVNVFRTAVEADRIVNLPVLKTHDQCWVSLGIKNIKGIIPSAEKMRSHHLGVEQAIVDLNRRLPPALVVIDGSTALEGLGPAHGDPVKMDLVIAGRNALATDMVGTRVMDLDPGRIKYLRLAAKAGLGPKSMDEIRVLGATIASVARPFKTAQQAVEEQYREMGISVVSRNVCSGCWTEFRHVYYELKEERKKLAGYTFVLGQVEEAPKGGKTVVIGTCASRVASCGAYCSGCPPHHTAIAETVRRLIAAG